MLITLKNKDTLVVGDFIFKCAIGKAGVKNKKKEGDKSTPRGLFSLGKIYFRPDRVSPPLTNLKLVRINKYMGWCDDSKNKNYNKEIKTNNKIKHEKLFRKDSLYDYLMIINYNTKKPKPFLGSAIFLHLTKNYKPTLGCIAIKKKDFLIIAQLLNKKTKIKID
jgi:L,D-peptidoglycan transpeptidase YkuD (ErfK/YbiS/YcfS/YnhG family)